MRKTPAVVVNRLPFKDLLKKNYFTLFDLPYQFLIDVNSLKNSWHILMSRIHPDLYAMSSNLVKQESIMLSSYVNEAYRQLKDPILRAQYLCKQAGVNLDMNKSHILDQNFLLQQIKWQEMLRNSKKDPEILIQLKNELKIAQESMYILISNLLDNNKDYTQAAYKLIEWIFIEKLSNKV